MLNEKHLCKMAPRKDSINESYVNHAVLFFLMMESDFFFSVNVIKRITYQLLNLIFSCFC